MVNYDNRRNSFPPLPFDATVCGEITAVISEDRWFQIVKEIQRLGGEIGSYDCRALDLQLMITRKACLDYIVSLEHEGVELWFL